MVGGSNVIVRQKAPNSARIGSSIDEWAATSMWMRALSTSRAASVASSSSTSASGPDATHRSAALTAAMLSPVGQQRAQLVLGQRHADHRPLRQRLEQAPAQRDERQAVLHRHDAGQAGGGVLAGAVADHRRRRDAPRLEQAAHRHLGGEQRRAGRSTAPPGARVASSRSPSGYSAASRSTPPAARRRVGAVVDDGPVDGLLVVQLATHAGVLRAAARHHEHDRRRARRGGGRRPAWPGASRRSAASCGDVATTARRIANGLRPARRVKATSARSMSGWARRWAASSAAARRATSAVRPGHRDQLGRPRRARRLDRRRLLDDHVGVGAAGAEPGDPGDAGAARARAPTAAARR